MAAIADSRGTYSWWWDSHITPKNSKWLQENLSDMDDKVLDMLKLIEEDGDSFARRAEMFYQRRPKLLELIEQFHRAYRALAERYDHASGVLRQAHNTVSEAISDTSEFDVGKFLSTKISDLQEHVLRADAEIETLRLNLERVESERDAATAELTEVAEEKEAFAIQCREISVRISELNSELEISNAKCGLLEKSNRELRSELDESVRKMGDQSEELIDKIKELSRVWQEHLRSEDVEAAFEKIHDFRSEIRTKDRELSEKVEELSSALMVTSRLRDENVRLRDIAKQLEVDIERQVNHQNSLHREIDRLKNEIEATKFETNEKIEESRNRTEASWLVLMFSQWILIAERENSEKRYRESEIEKETLAAQNARLRFELDEERKRHSTLISVAENQVEQLQRDLEETNTSIDLLRSSEDRVCDMEFIVLESKIESSILYTVLRQMDTEVTKIEFEREKYVSSLVGSVVASNIREKLLEDRINDLTDAKGREIEELKERIELLEGENVELASLLATKYRMAAEITPQECEKECQKVDYLEIKDIKQIPKVQIYTGESKLQNIVKPREDGDEESRPLLRKETRKRNVRQDKPARRRPSSQGDSDIFVTKDVVLDHPGAEDRILEELWEAAEVSSSINLKVGIRSRGHSRVASSHRSKDSLSLTEKELGVDGEIEMKVREPSRRRSARKVLERLNADVQKLTNLQITVQDLRRKVELTDQRAEEYDNVKEQLEETEVAIMNFFDTNQKLIKSLQKMENSKERSESVRKVSEQARRVTEEIGRLQVELQRIQWLLVKLDEEDKKEKIRGGSRPPFVPAERKANKIALKDILHVRVKKSMKKKKGQFCGCVHPPSRSE